MAQAGDLLAQMRDLQRRTLAILSRAEGSRRELRTALAAIGEARRNLELLGKLAGELQQEGTVSLVLSAEWIELRTIMLRVLAPYPDARLLWLVLWRTAVLTKSRSSLRADLAYALDPAVFSKDGHVAMPFGEWLWEVTPSWSWDWPHLVYTREALHKITTGEIKQLMICEPPRHGMSEMVTVRYPVWRMERDPAFRVILGAYNQTMANRFSRLARRIARERLDLSEERTATDDWETVQGGGVRAAGVGGGITGRGGDLIVIDDPVKSREEANSLDYRDRVWDWWTDDIYTRLEPGGAVILIMTRWHKDDLAGRILAGPDGASWVQLILPAEAEENDPLGRQVGAPLCPERYDKPELEQIHQVLGSWSYAALYQQRPQPAEGGLAKRVWFDKIVDRAPAGGWRYRAWDLAATEKKLVSNDPDYTVGTLMVRANGHYYVEDVVRARVGPGAVEALILQTAKLDGRGVPIHLAQDPGQAGKAQVAALARMLAGWIVRSDRVTGDKVTNAMPFLAQAEHGNVSLVRGEWNRAWLDEMCVFPVGKHEDQVDATADAFNALSQVRPPLPRVRVRILRG